jgi:hypothetical protein
MARREQLFEPTHDFGLGGAHIGDDGAGRESRSHGLAHLDDEPDRGAEDDEPRALDPLERVEGALVDGAHFDRAVDGGLTVTDADDAAGEIPAAKGKAEGAPDESDADDGHLVEKPGHLILQRRCPTTDQRRGSRCAGADPSRDVKTAYARNRLLAVGGRVNIFLDFGRETSINEVLGESGRKERRRAVHEGPHYIITGTCVGGIGRTL